MKSSLKILIAAAIVLTAGPALAAADPSVKCQSAKSKAVGGYYACRKKAEASAIAKGVAITSSIYDKCKSNFMVKAGGAASTYSTDCPDYGTTAADEESYVAGQSDAAAGVISGTPIASPACGDGSIDVAGENCDGTALGGKTCASFGMYGTLACTAGCDFDLTGCTACPASTISYLDSCWVLGARGSSCTSACTTLGLTYDDATLTETGSSGTDANCLAVLDATGAPGDKLDNAGGDCVGEAAGCMVLPDYGFRARCGTPATTESNSNADAERICACK